MNLNSYNPNRVRAQCATNSTNWQIVGKSGAGYASYALLLANGDVPFPGTPADFPVGIPNMTVRAVAAGGTGDGGTMAVITNTLATPVAEDDLISASGQTLSYTDEAIKSVWVKKTTGTDIAIITGYF